VAIGGPGRDPKKMTYYLADEPVTILGCATQGQFCLPTRSSEKCSPLGGTTWDWRNMQKTLRSEMSNKTSISLFWFTYSVMDQAAPTYGIIKNLRAAALKARDHAMGGRSSVLPSDQWQVEVQVCNYDSIDSPITYPISSIGSRSFWHPGKKQQLPELPGHRTRNGSSFRRALSWTSIDTSAKIRYETLSVHDRF
jgi:hypothetical protein